MRISIPAVCLLAIVLDGASAAAQEPGRVGITMGYPGTIGVILRVTDRVAVRPGISFSRASTEIEPAPSPGGFPTSLSTESSGWTTVADLGVLFYVARWDNLRAYVAPSYGYQRSTSTVTTSITTPLSNTTQTSTLEIHGHDARGTLGLQYALHRRFAAYGEFGMQYTRSTSTGLSTIRRTTNSSIGTRTGVGVIFYF